MLNSKLYYFISNSFIYSKCAWLNFEVLNSIMRYIKGYCILKTFSKIISLYNRY